MVFARFWSENGYRHFIFLESGMVFEETTEVMYLSFQFQMNKKEREIWEFKMDFF